MTTRAVVIGGSIAGLLAARVLSEHFDSVTIIDRDHPPSTPQPRKGAPQGRHGHGLLAAGSAVMDELFPGMFAAMVAAGAVESDAADGVWWFSNGAWRLQADTGVRGYLQSRPFLEFHLRKRLLQLRGVSEGCGCAVEGLQFDAARRRVTGARVAREGGDAEIIPADLVVDCSGRGSRLPAWLEEAGWPQPEVNRVEVNVGYSSRILRPAAPPPWKALLLLGHAPKQSRLGVMFPVEGDWMVTLGGEFRDYPPDDEAGYLEFARSLSHPVLYQQLCAAAPVTPIVTYRFAAHVWHHYERLQDWPHGLLALGDGVCSFNPIYGQGMTVAALEAAVLRRCLREQQHAAGNSNGNPLAAAYYKGITAPISAAWAMAVGADLAYPEAVGPRTRAGAWIGEYLSQVIALTSYDAQVLKEWVLVTHMVKPMSAIFHPRIAARVLRRAIAGGPPLPTDRPPRTESRK